MGLKFPQKIMTTEQKDSVTTDKSNAFRNLVLKRLDLIGINPNEALGQHFLTDRGTIDLLARQVSPGNTVIEIGAGVGQLTEALADRAAKVVTVEIDRRYEPVLQDIERKKPNVKVVFGDAIALGKDLYKDAKDDTQIVASLPYHITEPFLHMIAPLPIESTTLVVGQRLVNEIQAQNPESVDFGKLTLLAQTFFDIEVLAEISKQSFYPAPRTESAIIKLTPKDIAEARNDKKGFILRRLFTTARRNPLVKNCIKEALIEYAEVSQMRTLSKKEHHTRIRTQVRTNLREMASDYNQYGSLSGGEENTNIGIMTQNQARAIIERAMIPDGILGKPFEQLSNGELRVLSKGLTRMSV